MRNTLTAIVILSSIAFLYADNRSTPHEKLYHESLRPQFHFTARYWDDYRLNPQPHEEGWLNDLNGLVYHEGEYHLFAQRWWSAWLHAISTDLIHWEEMRPAFGKGGTFGGTQSGGCVIDLNNCSGLGDGKEPPMIAFWSSTDNKNQCISYSLDKGRTWSKFEKNPVLTHEYRDPTVFWYEPDKKWIMILYGPHNKTFHCRYGFNGEENDTHNMHDFTAEQWTCSVIRLFGDGKVVATDQNGQSTARIDINKQNIGNEVFNVGAKANGTEFFEGDIAEILIYNRSLSEEETQIMLADLQSKWGLNNNNNNKVFLSDIPTNGLVLHLDAKTVTADTENTVTIWKDTSGNNNHVRQPTAESKPKRIDKELGGHPVIRFEGRQFMQGPAVLEQGDDTLTIVALWKRTKNNGSQVICEQNTRTPHEGRRASLLTTCNEESDNAYLLFSSTNLLEWKKLDGYIADSFECPDMFELSIEGQPESTKWVVVDANGDYLIGSFNGEQFTPETKKMKGDYGRNFYATRTFQNMPYSDARRIQLAWMRGWDDYPKNMPFNQQVTFPCELTLRKLPEGIIMCRYPIREISKIWEEGLTLQNYILKSNDNPLSGLQGDLFDINVVIDVSQSNCSEIILNLLGNTVKYKVIDKVLNSVGSETLLEPKDGLIEIRALVDRLSIESYGNRGEVSITNIAYQKKANPPLELKAAGGTAKVVSLTAYKVKSIWN